MYGAVATAFLTSVIRGYTNSSDTSPVIPMVLFGSYEDDEIGGGEGITFHAKDFPFILLIGLIGGLVNFILVHVYTKINFIPFHLSYCISVSFKH